MSHNDEDRSDQGVMGGKVSAFCHQWALYAVAKIITLPMIRMPFQDLSSPSKYGLPNAVDLRILFPSEGGGKSEWMGAWFIRPGGEADHLIRSSSSGGGAAERWRRVARREEPADKPEDNDDVYLTDSNETVVLYLHGNAKTRSDHHRVELYKVLVSMGLPVLAIDYRGYADSSSLSVNSEKSFVEDAALAFGWLRRFAHPTSKVLVWGHSLGTGITVALAEHMSSRSPRPEFYVLEAPFLSIAHAAQTAYLGYVWTLCGNLVVRLIDESDLSLDSGSRIKSVREPIAIFHSECDSIVPYCSGQSLHLRAVDGKCNVTMFTYGKELKLGHNDIYQSDQMRRQLAGFLSSVGGDE